jgi:hypothetical protein
MRNPLDGSANFLHLATIVSGSTGVTVRHAGSDFLGSSKRPAYEILRSSPVTALPIQAGDD